MRYLPDVNFWLALLSASHVHHAACREWWNESGRPPIDFIRETKNGVLRLLTNEAAMKDEVMTAGQAWRVLDEVAALREVGWVGEPAEADQLFRRATTHLRRGNSAWGDSWLLAVAEASERQIVTLDRGLAKRAPDRVRCLA